MDAACKFLREQCAATTAPTALSTSTVAADVDSDVAQKLAGIQKEIGYSLPVDAQTVHQMCRYVDGMCRAAAPSPTPTPAATRTATVPSKSSSGSGWVILVVLAIAIAVLSK